MMVLLIVTILALSLCLFMLLRMRKHRKHIQHLAKLIRRSALYEQLGPLINRCGRRKVSEIVIKENMLLIQIAAPKAHQIFYSFEDHGFDNLTPEYLEALAVAICMDLPQLRDRKAYRFYKKSESGRTYYLFAVRPV